MRVTIDTNPLIRTVVRDDPSQAEEADRLLDEALLVAIPLPCICEFVWVLGSVYRFARAELIAAVEALLEIDKVQTDNRAVEAGLKALRDGADFADGVIAYEGRRLGGEVFVSFDRKAVAAMRKQGYTVRLA